MTLIDTVHVEGFLASDDEEFGWNETFKRRDGSEYTQVEGHIISSLLKNLNEKATKLVKCNRGNDYEYDDEEFIIDNVAIQLYFTDHKTTLDQAYEFMVLDSMGCLEGNEGWFGYSEYTILGYCTNNFTVGGHDILAILENHEGKYCHIVMSVYE